jgi:hypothetical protein
MAGKQFSFYIGLTDQIAIEEAIRASGDVIVLEDRSPTDRGVERESSIMRDPESEIYRVLIARRADLPLIRFRPTGSTDRDFWCDPYNQPIVQFSRPLYFKRFIRAGRMYRHDRYYNEHDELVSKSAEFIEWADRLYKLVKKSLIKIERGRFAGSEAIAMRQSGIPFEELDIEFDSVEESILGTWRN